MKATPNIFAEGWKGSVPCLSCWKFLIPLENLPEWNPHLLWLCLASCPPSSGPQCDFMVVSFFFQIVDLTVGNNKTLVDIDNTRMTLDDFRIK